MSNDARCVFIHVIGFPPIPPRAREEKATELIDGLEGLHVDGGGTCFSRPKKGGRAVATSTDIALVADAGDLGDHIQKLQERLRASGYRVKSRQDRGHGYITVDHRGGYLRRARTWLRQFVG